MATLLQYRLEMERWPLAIMIGANGEMTKEQTQ
jgi:hypothetical protein